MDVWLLRHAESYSNVNGFISASPPGPGLTIRGKKDASNVGAGNNILFNSVYASPYNRTVETFEHIKKACEILKEVPLYTDPRLEELNYGNFDGVSLVQIKEKISSLFNASYNGDIDVRFGKNGESFREFLLRILEFLIEIRSVDVAKVLLITHGSVMTEIIRLYEMSENIYDSVYLPKNCEMIHIPVRNKMTKLVLETYRNYL